MVPAAIVLRLENVTKRFGSFVASDSISFDLSKGQVHVLLGENGAGKSTLLNMLYGHFQPDGGWIEVFGRRVEIVSPTVALKNGIGLVHQHFTLVPSFTVAENVLLGRKSSLPKEKRSPASVQETVDQLGWDIDIAQRIETLSVAGRQHVELLKLLHGGAQILLMDEPTSLLSPKEIDALLLTIERLAAKGTSVLLVTHKLREVTQVAHHVTVIRQGVVAARFDAGQADETELARAMTGRKKIPKVTVTGIVDRSRRPVLEVDDLSLSSEHGLVVNGVTLEVHPGEIVGIAGVEGNGQTELMAAIAGIRVPAAGRIRVAGADVTHESPRTRRLAGLSVVPADRRAEGLVGDMSVFENLALNQIACGRSRWPPWSTLQADAARTVETYDIRPRNITAQAGLLSGGNAQKVVLAREFLAKPKVLIASSPTWGLDVGAIADVRERILEARNNGCAILLNSPDLDEILELSDRIAVMYRGVIALNEVRDEIDMDRLSLAMIGRSVDAQGQDFGNMADHSRVPFDTGLQRND